MNKLFLIFLTIIYFNIGNLNAIDPLQYFYDKIEQFLTSDRGDLIYVCKEELSQEDENIKFRYTKIVEVKNGNPTKVVPLEDVYANIYSNLDLPRDDALINLIKAETKKNSYWDFVQKQAIEAGGIPESECEMPIIIAEKWMIKISDELLQNISSALVNIHKIYIKSPYHKDNPDWTINKYTEDNITKYNKIYEQKFLSENKELIEDLNKKKSDLINNFNKISILSEAFDELTTYNNKIKRCFNEDENKFLNQVHCPIDLDKYFNQTEVKELTKNKFFEKLLKSQKPNSSSYIIDPIIKTLDKNYPNLKNKHEEKIKEIDEIINSTNYKIVELEKKEKEKRIKDKEKQEKIKAIQSLLEKYNFNNLIPLESLINDLEKLDSDIEKIIGSDNPYDIAILSDNLNNINGLNDRNNSLKDKFEENINKAQETLNNFQDNKIYKKYKKNDDILERQRKFTNYIDELTNVSAEKLYDGKINELESFQNTIERKLNLLEDSKLKVDDLKNKLDDKVSEINDLNDKLSNLETSLSSSKRNLIIIIIFFIMIISGLGYHIYRLRTLGEYKLKDSFNAQFKSLKDKHDNLIIEHNSTLNELSSVKKSEIQVEKKVYKNRFDENSDTENPQIIVNPISELIKLYETVLKDPNMIDAFKETYQGVGLDRQSRIISQSNTILVKDTKDFSRANFWLMSVENKLILLPGRTLKVNVSSLVADNARYARDLLSGIFNYNLSNEFRLHQYGIMEMHGDHYVVKDPGSIDLPQI